MCDIYEQNAPINFTPHEDIVAAVNSFELIDQLDTALLTNDERTRLKEIKVMCIEIIYSGIKEIYMTNCYGEADT